MGRVENKTCLHCNPIEGKCLRVGSLDTIAEQVGQKIGGLVISAEDLEQATDVFEQDILPECMYDGQMKASIERARAKIRKLRT